MGDQDEDPVALAAKLSLSDRVVHKHWKVRETAYRELADKCNTAEEDAKIYFDFAPLLGKIARDANAPAQLVGLEAVAKFADTAPPSLVRKVTADVSKGITEKGLSGRPVNKQRAVDTLVMFCGADCGDITVDILATVGFSNRTPKVVAASLDTVTLAVQTYGSGAVPVKVFAAKLAPLFKHSNELVRNAAKALVIEMHRWVGSAISPVIKDAKPVTIKEIEAAFAENATKPKPKANKLTRAKELRVRERGGGNGDGEDSDDGFGAADGEEEEEVDLAEEIDLMEKLGKTKIEIEEGVRKDWFTALDSTKWAARKRALDSAIDIIGDSRLIPASHQEVIVRLRKVFAKDSNVNVVASAAKLVAAMASGLKKNFPAPGAKAMTADLFGRFKEKNRVVLAAVSSALDLLHEKKCIKVFELVEEIKAAAKHKAPKARAEVLLWLSRCFKSGTAAADLKGAPLKEFGAMLVLGSEDSTSDVRDAALSGLAALQVLVGERNVSAYVQKLDKKRQEKVAAMVAEMPAPKRVTASKAAKPGSAKPAEKDSKVVKKAVPVKGAVKKKPPPKAVVEESDDEGEASHTPEDALAAAAERFEGFEAEQWSAKSFKARMAVVETVKTPLEKKETLNPEDISIILGLLQCEPGLNDSNFMAVKPKLQLLGLVAEKCTAPPPRKTLRGLLLVAVEKLGDIKCAIIASGIMMSFAEATSARFFFEILSQAIRETKNARAVVGMLKFAAKVVEDFGIPTVPAKAIAELVAATGGSPAAAARNAALALSGRAGARTPAGTFRKSLESAGAASEVLEAFDMEIEKYGTEPDPPTRKKRFGIAADVFAKAEAGVEVDETGAKEETEQQASTVDISAVSPTRSAMAPGPSPMNDDAIAPPAIVVADENQSRTRVSVADKFGQGSEILRDMKNPNWKKRQDTLALIDTIVSNANSFIKPNVGPELMSALRARLCDSNRNLAAAAFGVVGRLVKAMGIGATMHVKVIMPVVLGQGCVDIKRSVREASLQCLECWFETVGLAPLIVFLPLPIASLNSSFRREFLEWLVPRLSGKVGGFVAEREDLSPLVDPCLACVRDRTAEVRQLGEIALGQVLASVGLPVVESKVTAMSKSARLQLDPILERLCASQGGIVGAGREVSPMPQKREKNSPNRFSSRERPKSMAVSPRTPSGGRRPFGMHGEAEGSLPENSTGRRPRPASARYHGSPATPMGSSASPRASSVPLLKENQGHQGRARRYLAKRRRLAAEFSGTDSADEVLPYTGEHIDDLARDLRECVSPILFSKLMAPANRFQQHIEAVNVMRPFMENNPDAMVSVADVLLRWAACRFEDARTPPTVMTKVCDFVSGICEILLSSGVKLSDYEAAAIIPAIVDKCGSNRDSVRQAMLACLLAVGDVIAEDVMLIFLAASLRQPINALAYDEVSVEICRLIDRRCASGAGIPAGVLPVIARVAAGPDDSAGRAAAACLARASEHFGEDLWDLLGPLTDQQLSMMDDRLKCVVEALQRDAPSPTRQYAQSPRRSLDSVYGQSSAQDTHAPQRAGAPFPVDIRNEDFRLSVAPAPLTTVDSSSLNDPFTAATPALTSRSISRIAAVEATPGVPRRQSRSGSSVLPSKASAAALAAASTTIAKLKNISRSSQLSGLSEVYEDLKQPYSVLLHEKAIEVLPLLSRGFGDVLQRIQEGTACEDDDFLLRKFLNAVMAFARQPHVIRRLDQPTVEAFLGDIMNAMLPDSMPGFENWDKVRRGVNMVVLKVLESCDQNALFAALLNMLLANIDGKGEVFTSHEDGDSIVSPKSALCIKSLAKVAKRGFAECKVDVLLRDMHLFLVAHPIRKDGAVSQEDTEVAMRLLKTIVNALIDEFGASVRAHLSLISQPETSQLVHYITMTLQYETESGDEARRRVLSSSSAGTDSPPVVRQAAVDGTDETNPQVKLTSIFARIQPHDPTDVGLRQLRAFMLCHPDVSINPHLGKCSDVFQGYVKDGLRRIENEEAVVAIRSDSGTRPRETGGVPMKSRSGEGEHRAATSGQQGPSSGASSAGHVYLQRLHEIQMRYGLHEAEPRQRAEAAEPRGAVDSTSRVVEKENGNLDAAMSIEETRGKASALRERMARIRDV